MNQVGRRSGLALAGVLLLASAASASPDAAGTGWPLDFRTVGLGFAAALALGIGIVGASYAIAKIGTAAMGAAAEKPELLMRSLLFVALAEGLAVLAFALAMMILQKN